MDDERALRDAMNAGVEAACQVLREKRKKDEEGLEEQKREFAEEVERFYTGAEEAGAKVKATAEAAAAAIMREARAQRAALDAEKAAMAKTYAFQKGKIKLDVGATRSPPPGQPSPRWPTRSSTRWRPDAFCWFPTPTARTSSTASGAHFEHILNYLRDPGRNEKKLLATFTRCIVSILNTRGVYNAVDERDASACMRRHQASALTPEQRGG